MFENEAHCPLRCNCHSKNLKINVSRFRNGLSTLDVIHALEQHPNLFRPCMCSSLEKLTSESLKGIFKIQLSEVGSTRRQEETRILGHWRDYLLETEGSDMDIRLSYIQSYK